MNWMISNIIQILRNKSVRYILFRAVYFLELKTGLLSFRFPAKCHTVPILLLNGWLKECGHWFFNERKSIHVTKSRSAELKEKMAHIMSGDILFFGKEWKYLGLDYDWVTNPQTGYKYDVRRHWSKIQSLSREAGDIKFVWEKSRFSWLLTVCRYDYHFEEDHSDFVIEQILDWIDKNPLNCGPNYKCSQEISIRLNNWLFALHFYKYSKALTEGRFQRIITFIYGQACHVYSNINYSRISVRNNHAITETLTLYIMGLLFPMMPNAAKWKKNGKRWFEKEIAYQIEDDGTYLQNSMNYHRVVIQLLTYAIAIADANGEKFQDFVYDRAYKSLNFLFQCQEPSNGWLPNYGSNDGALFFPLSDADYRDYRPQLDALHGLLTGEPLYGNFLEDFRWIGHPVPSYRTALPKIQKQYGLLAFRKSGFYLIREADTLTFIRCGLFKSNGSTDQLHMDVWYKGENVLMDGGSFMYNTDEATVRYFAGTESHNTIMLGEYDQMLKGPRFMWFFPPVIMSAEMQESDSYYEFNGKICAFKQINRKGITISRCIRKIKGRPEWEITDTFKGVSSNLVRRQLWHTESQLLFSSDAECTEQEGWISDYYGIKRNVQQIEYRTKKDTITTTIKIHQ